MNAVLGIADHYGAAEFVTVGESSDSFRLLDRKQVALIDPKLPSSPYHHDALKLPLDVAEELIAKVRVSVADCCRRVLLDEIAKFGFGAVAIQASPYPALPNTLQEILASWQITCAADGMLYREQLATSAAELGLHVERYARKSDRVAAAAEALQMSKPVVVELLKSFGKQAGAPWKKEHQEAAASALALLRQ